MRPYRASVAYAFSTDSNRLTPSDFVASLIEIHQVHRIQMIGAFTYVHVAGIEGSGIDARRVVVSERTAMAVGLPVVNAYGV
jgi:hypothetical protein